MNSRPLPRLKRLPPLKLRRPKRLPLPKRLLPKRQPLPRRLPPKRPPQRRYVSFVLFHLKYAQHLVLEYKSLTHNPTRFIFRLLKHLPPHPLLYQHPHLPQLLYLPPLLLLLHPKQLVMDLALLVDRPLEERSCKKKKSVRILLTSSRL